MGSLSATHWVLVAIVALVLFGRGRISETMGDFGKGIRSFRAGIRDVQTAPAIEPVGELPPAEVMQGE